MLVEEVALNYAHLACVVWRYLVKPDRKDAVKLVKYALDRWAELPAYTPEDENAGF